MFFFLYDIVFIEPYESGHRFYVRIFEGTSDNCRFIVVIFVFLHHDAYPVFVGTITIYIIFLLHVAGDYDDTCQAQCQSDNIDYRIYFKPA